MHSVMSQTVSQVSKLGPECKCPLPPLNGNWEIVELGNFLKLIDLLQIVQNKLNMKNIGTKSTNMSDI